MGFIIDKQTLDDLIIFGKGNSVYGIFNCTHTRGEVFLAHAGFPVSAKRMEFTDFVQDEDAGNYYIAVGKDGPMYWSTGTMLDVHRGNV